MNVAAELGYVQPGSLHRGLAPAEACTFVTAHPSTVRPSRRKPGPRRSACKWCGSSSCTHCQCDGYAGCTHGAKQQCPRSRYKRRLVCNPCEKHKLDHARKVYNCTPKQLETFATNLQRAARGSCFVPNKRMQTVYVKVCYQGRVRRFQVVSPMRFAALSDFIAAGYNQTAATLRFTYHAADGSDPIVLADDTTLRKATAVHDELCPGRCFKMHIRQLGSTREPQHPMMSVHAVPAVVAARNRRPQRLKRDRSPGSRYDDRRFDERIYTRKRRSTPFTQKTHCLQVQLEAGAGEVPMSLDKQQATAALDKQMGEASRLGFELDLYSDGWYGSLPGAEAQLELGASTYGEFGNGSSVQAPAPPAPSVASGVAVPDVAPPGMTHVEQYVEQWSSIPEPEISAPGVQAMQCSSALQTDNSTEVAPRLLFSNEC